MKRELEQMDICDRVQRRLSWWYLVRVVGWISKRRVMMLTKRQLLQYVGSVAGAAGVYRSMAALGMLGVSSLTGCT